MSDMLDEAAVNQLDSDQLLPCQGVYAAMLLWCGIGDEDDNKKKLEVLSNI